MRGCSEHAYQSKSKTTSVLELIAEKEVVDLKRHYYLDQQNFFVYGRGRDAC